MGKANSDIMQDHLVANFPNVASLIKCSFLPVSVLSSLNFKWANSWDANRSSIEENPMSANTAKAAKLMKVYQ